MVVGALPRLLHCVGLGRRAPQVDKTSKENKNGFMLGFYGWLCGLGLFKSVTVNFFRVGLN